MTSGFAIGSRVPSPGDCARQVKRPHTGTSSTLYIHLFVRVEFNPQADNYYITIQKKIQLAAVLSGHGVVCAGANRSKLSFFTIALLYKFTSL